MVPRLPSALKTLHLNLVAWLLLTPLQTSVDCFGGVENALIFQKQIKSIDPTQQSSHLQSEAQNADLSLRGTAKPDARCSVSPGHAFVCEVPEVRILLDGLIRLIRSGRPGENRKGLRGLLGVAGVPLNKNNEKICAVVIDSLQNPKGKLADMFNQMEAGISGKPRAPRSGCVLPSRQPGMSASRLYLFLLTYGILCYKLGRESRGSKAGHKSARASRNPDMQ